MTHQRSLIQRLEIIWRLTLTNQRTRNQKFQFSKKRPKTIPGRKKLNAQNIPKIIFFIFSFTTVIREFLVFQSLNNFSFSDLKMGSNERTETLNEALQNVKHEAFQMKKDFDDGNIDSG